MLKVLSTTVVVAFLSGCAVFSDGATVDYSRLFNIPLTFFSDGGSGTQQPWEADTGYKQNRGIYGNQPWMDITWDGPADSTTHLYPGGGIKNCFTWGNMTNCQ